ncbi:ABC transporter ATP-binding protein [Conexibacter sp. JD483]|uniref:ABC transporter ATP-binding protein n=1 Tax=unclassified Conexibacter TaxID=2627773 RepID=UPI0027177C10|nr:MULTISPECIES: ABC transporter ATP-binding protein [unclassified Conexibacter]MDO8186945.1 ABC transporter ATP-binding protein [Conexibacter sp. CPCC 205706]MDO8200600.1 ABC transporter ATP-binding protein [Conexibacter sp. CPCC 205762]MDR9368822.1 ABC transporter ATP-binding protein [Conexibacter sp. JD483]
MPADALLEVRGVSCGYGETTIVRNAELTVGAGETLCLVGPNGHGKSTLLRAITGLLPLSAGEVRFGGERIDGRAAEQLTELGIVHIPQGDHLFPDLTVEENLLMGAFPKGAWKDRGTALDEVFARFPKLKDRRRQRARTLSGGERRMVAIGRGLMRQPRLLVIDEPSLGLAPVIVESVYEIIAGVAAQRTTSILLVEENFTHVEEVADRVSVLEMGRIVRTGLPAELADDAAVTQSYLGALPS